MRTLGQSEWWLWDLPSVSLEPAPVPEVQTTGESVWSAIGARAEQFFADYAAWLSTGRAEVALLTADLADAASVLAGSVRVALDTGDTDAERTLAVVSSEISDLRILAGDIRETDARWADTWSTLYDWLSSARRTLGLGLAFLPIAITAAVAVSAVAALAWVVASWSDLRTRAGVVKDIAARLAAGQLTPQQARDLTAAITPAGLFSGFSSVAGVALLLGAAWLLLGTRGRT